jgi:hypothetical protein
MAVVAPRGLWQLTSPRFPLDGSTKPVQRALFCPHSVNRSQHSTISFEINGPRQLRAKTANFAEENCSLCVNPGVKIAAYA